MSARLSEFESAIPSGEHWVTEIRYNDRDDKNKEYALVLTNAHYLKVDPSKGKVVFRKEYRELERAEPGGISPPMMKLVSASVGHTSMFGGSGKPKSAQVLEVPCPSSAIREELVYVFRNLIRANWQKFFEGQYLNPPEIYQSHFFVSRVAKHTQHSRMLLLSDHMLYYMDTKSGSLDISKQKWSCSVKGIESIKLGTDAVTFTIVFGNPPEKDEKEYTFHANSEEERKLIVHEIRRAVFHRENTVVPCVR